MAQSRIARLGIVIAFAGLLVLGASLFHWNQTTRSRGLFYSDSHYEWTIASASNKPAIAQDEIWGLDAVCVKPFYFAQARDFESKLASHNATKPPPVVLDPPKKKPYIIDPDMQRQSDALDRHVQVTERNWKAIDQVSKIYGTYDSTEFETLQKALADNDLAVDPVWIATRVRLGLLIKRWKTDAADVEDKRVAKSEIEDAAARPDKVSNLAISLAIRTAKTGDEKFELAAKHLLGLRAFSDDLAKTIRQKCVEALAVKQVLANTTYGTDIERWPVEAPAPFWTGIGLALFGLLLGPIVFWVKSGRG